MADNTFLGLQPYTEDDAYRFKGRAEESQELFRLIVRNDFTVCYAESGEGKTSLLNAGVFPLLRENMYFPIAITFTSDDYKVTPDSFDTIIDRCIKDSIAEYNEKSKGVNVEYQLCSTDFQGLNNQVELQRELSKHSWWKLRNYKPQAMGLTFTPVFVFDQFEEVFNLPGSIVWTKKFFDWLEDISSDSCPDVIVKKVREIIGDKAAFPIIKEEKGFKAVFSLRKEFIGELDYWGMQTHFVPALKDNRYCLKALAYEGAKKVMTQQERFDTEKVEQILTYFVSQYSREPKKTIEEGLPVIPALLLSVVCDSWEKDMDAFVELSTAEIGQSLNSVLERFFDEAVNSVVSKLCAKEPDLNLSDFIRNDIETALFDLVDVNGKRVRVKAVSTRGTIMFREKSEKELRICRYKEILRDARIIRVIKVDGEDYVEIVHDALCSVVSNKQVRKMKEIADNAMRKMEETERRKRKVLYQSVVMVMCLLLIIVPTVWWYIDNMPTTVAIGIKECPPFNNNLPPLKDAIVKMKIGNEERIDTIHSLINPIEYANIPKKLIGKMAYISVECQNYIMIDTVLYLSRDNDIFMHRDPLKFGGVRFRLWDIEEEKPVAHALIRIEGYRNLLKTDDIGRVSINIPIEQQKTKYHIIYSSELQNDTLYMPCGEDDVLFVKK